MTLEAQLLQIIEQQQNQLLSQQLLLDKQLSEQQKALTSLEAQGVNISELQNYIATLLKYTKLLREKNTEQTAIIDRLKNPEFLMELLRNLEESLQQQLQIHLTELITGLDLKSQTQALLPQIMSPMVKTEIEKQTKQLAGQLNEKMDSIEHYHAHLEDLIHQLSARL